MIVVTAGQPTVSPELEALVLAFGGVNVHGKPRYRLVWGGSRMSLEVGYFNDYDESGNFLRRVLDRRADIKYFMCSDRFHMEAWLSPDEYVGMSPEAWAKKTSIHMGQVVPPAPFPHEGEYESFAVCNNPDGSAATPTSSWVERAIELHRACRAISRETKARAAAAKTAAMRKTVRQESADFIDSLIKATFWGDHVSYAGLSSPNHRTI